VELTGEDFENEFRSINSRIRIRNRKNLEAELEEIEDETVNITSRFSQAEVIEANIKAKNGVIHIINNVL
jgi:uncharacterized surface protein with fasciclin (FAS1) repeats